MSELTAQMVERGRGVAPADAARRRRLSHDIRTARERLTSSSGLQRTFEYELVRLYAENHSGSSAAVLLLAVAIGAVATLWFPLAVASGWLTLVVAVLGLQFALSARFRRADPDAVVLSEWQRWFVSAELMSGAVWAAALHWLAAIEGGTNGFALFVAVMAAAVTTVLSATIPAAVYAGMVPLILAMAIVMATARGLPNAMLVAMTASALLFFLVLANRLYSSTLSSIRSRAEKGQLFVELEEAKANSAEARRRAEEFARAARQELECLPRSECRAILEAITDWSIRREK